MIDDTADWDAAYVLGALGRDDRRRYETYLTDHPDRAAALTELAGMPGILKGLTRDDAHVLRDRRRGHRTGGGS